jgi:hypothetical protein
MPGAKSYPRDLWDEFFRALEALPEKPRNEQRVTVSDAMKEMRAQIAATQAKGYTLAEIVQEAASRGLDVTMGAVKYALYRPAAPDANGDATNSRRRSGGLKSSDRKEPSRQGDDACVDTRQQRVGSVNQPASIQIQNAFSTTFRPDTENL